ncbi:MAG TPA: hypothetical protein VFZ65_05520, partial [Planctomycetota bacterium]|nr:hypothetical protein [Planctomycetota bacterium]
MGGTRTLVCVLALAGGNEAQQLHLLRCGDAFVGPAAAASDAGGEARTIARFAEICERLTVAEGRQRMDGTMLRLQKTNAGKLLLVRDTADNIELVTKAVEQLMAEDAANPTRWRLQCSLVTLPAKVAAERGIVAGKVVPVDEAAASRLVRDAVAAKGSLQNLPEVVVNPLVPFVVERR